MGFNPSNARVFGRRLGKRYAERSNILWILGGDRPAVNGGIDYRPAWREMAAGIDEGAGVPSLKTYHPMGGVVVLSLVARRELAGFEHDAIGKWWRA